MKEEFDISGLIQAVCETYSITEDEYRSPFKYGNLSKARQAVCYILKENDFESADIASITGFSQARVINSIKAFEKSIKQ